MIYIYIYISYIYIYILYYNLNEELLIYKKAMYMLETLKEIFLFPLT